MKYQIHVPTEQYGFILGEIDSTADDAVIAYKELRRAWGGGPGLPRKEFMHCLDEFLTTGTVKDGVELWAQMDQSQQMVFQEVKKSMKRINKES